MTKEKAKQLIPLLQAYTEGKTIQYKDYNRWVDVGEPAFDKHSEYRIKPELKYRPWTFEEAPLLVIFKTKYCDGRFIFNNVSESGYLYKNTTYDFERMLEDFLYSSDNGKTWLPCGTLI
jgi:hypothetical protein